MRKWICSVIIGLMLLVPSGAIYAQPQSQNQAETVPPLAEKAEDGTPIIMADGAVLIDAGTGQVLFEKNKDKQKFPASTTKVMTAILAIENLDLSKDIPIDREAAFTEGSRVYLLENEVVTGEQILYGLMLESANDAAIAFAKNISGTTQDFAILMNKRAKEMGAKNTHFSNPNGLPDETHLTTAYDLAMIARYAMKNETFRKVVSTVDYKLPATNLQQERNWYNSNRLLWDTKKKLTFQGEKTPIKYEGATGIKTGFTKAAGNCLVASVQKDGREIIGVILGSDSNNQYLDMIKLFDYGFTNFQSAKIASAGELAENVTVKKGEDRILGAIIPEDIVISLPKDGDRSLVDKVYELPEKMEAPIDKNQVLGTMKLYYDKQLIGEYDLLAKESIAVGGWSVKLAGAVSALGKMKGILPVIIVILTVLLVLYVTLSIIVKIKKNRRKKRKLIMSKKLAEEERKSGVSRRGYDRARYEKEFGSANRYRDTSYYKSYKSDKNA